MCDMFFFLMMLQFFVGILFTKHIVGDNRGNIVNHPMWKKAVDNSLDGLLLSFVLYFIWVQSQDQIYIAGLSAVIFGLFLTAAVVGVAANYLLNRREQKRCSVGFTFNLDGLLPKKSHTWYTPELEYIKCTVVCFFKTLLVFWVALYFLDHFWLGKLGIWTTPTPRTMLYMNRYIVAIADLALCCVVDNLLAIIVNRDKRNRSPELEKIHQKLQLKNRKV